MSTGALPETHETSLFHTPLLVCHFLADGTVARVNTAWKHFFDWSHTSGLPASLFDCLPPPSAAELQAILPQLQTESAPITSKLQVTAGNGRSRFLQCTLRQIGVSSENIPIYQCIAQDMTEVYHRIEELQLMGDSIELIQDGLALLDPEGFCRFCNSAKARLHGLDSPKELVGHSLADLHIAEDRARLNEEILPRVRRNGTWCGELTALAGQTPPVPLQVTMTRLANGDIVSISKNLAGQKAQEKKLREAVSFQQDLIDVIPLPIFFKDTHGVYLGCNTAFCRHIAGSRRRNVVGKTIFDFFPFELAQEITLKEKALLARPAYRVDDDQFIFRDGEKHQVQCHRSTFTNEDGQIAGIVGIINDITEKRCLEQQIRDAQKLEIIGNLAGGIAHDFNNILSAIIGNAELAKRKLAANPELEELITNILTVSDRAQRLIHKMRAISQRTSPDRRPFSLLNLVNETVDLLRASLGDTISVDLQLPEDDGCTFVHGDQSQIHQVIMNLMTNAGQAIGDNQGTITVTLDAFCPWEKNADPQEQEGLVRLRVHDSGPGIAEDTIDHIFEPYITTKGDSGGSGLGLAVVRGIVEGHSGTITAENTDQGALFTLCLPSLNAGDEAPAPDAAEKDPAPAATIQEGEGHILLVDDDPELLQTGQECLESLGYTVTACGDPSQALHTFTRAPEHFDLVLTDNSMPGLSGLELASKVVEVKNDTPVLLMTGMALPSPTTPDQDMAVHEVLWKPVRLGDLATAVQRCLNRELRQGASKPDSPQ